MNQDDELIRMPRALKLAGVRDPRTIESMVKRGDFPPPHNPDAKRSMWVWHPVAYETFYCNGLHKTA